MVSTAGIAPAASAFAERRSDLSELRGQLALSQKLASVVGLAPTRPGLKGRPLELLCIHGQKNGSQGDRALRVAHSPVSLNPAVSNPPWRLENALPSIGTRLVSEQRTEGRDD